VSCFARQFDSDREEKMSAVSPDKRVVAGQRVGGRAKLLLQQERDREAARQNEVAKKRQEEQEARQQRRAKRRGLFSCCTAPTPSSSEQDSASETEAPHETELSVAPLSREPHQASKPIEPIRDEDVVLPIRQRAVDEAPAHRRSRDNEMLPTSRAETVSAKATGHRRSKSNIVASSASDGVVGIVDPSGASPRRALAGPGIQTDVLDRRSRKPRTAKDEAELGEITPSGGSNPLAINSARERSKAAELVDF
jgi:hypothetical protein